MRKELVFGFILISVVLFCSSFASASWFSGAFGKMTGNTVVTKSNVLQNCINGCLTFSCFEKDSFSKKICQSKNYKSCSDSCKSSAKSNFTQGNRQVAKVLDLSVSGCVGNVCKLYEGTSLKVGKDIFSINSLYEKGVILDVNGFLTEIIGKKQTFSFNQDTLKIVIIDLSAQSYTNQGNFVIFSVHRKIVPNSSNVSRG